MFVDKPGCPGLPQSCFRIDALNRQAEVALVYGTIGFNHYIYTIGNNLVGYPELLLFCAKRDRRSYSTLLRNFSQFMQQTAAVPVTQRQVTFQQNHFYPVWVDGIFVRRYAKMASPNTRTFSKEKVLQLLIPDSFGNYPHDVEYDHRFLKQPILQRH